MDNKNTKIPYITDVQDRLGAVYALAARAYGSEGDADRFMSNLHGGKVAESLSGKAGIRSLSNERSFICPEVVVREGARGTQRVVRYLEQRL